MKSIVEQACCRVRFEKPTVQMIRDVESELQFPLPASYREFLQDSHGGRFGHCFIDYDEATFDDPTLEPHAGINWLRTLYGIGESAGRDRLSKDRVVTDADGALLIIGKTIDSSSLMLELGGDSAEVWLHQGGPGINTLCATFDQFLGMLECRSRP